jgi:hypothetical protein
MAAPYDQNIDEPAINGARITYGAARRDVNNNIFSADMVRIKRNGLGHPICGQDAALPKTELFQP